MADKPISGLPSVATVQPTDILTSVRLSDPAGTKNKQITGLQVQTFVYKGKAGGNTITGGTGAGDNLVLESTENATKGEIQIADGTTLHANTANYETLVTDDNDIPNKKYVDDAISPENTWDRVTGATNYLIPAIAGDEIGATAARITKGWFSDLNSSDLTVDTFNINGSTLTTTGGLTVSSGDQISIANTANGVDITSQQEISLDAADGFGITVQNNDLDIDITSGDFRIQHLNTANGIVQTDISGNFSSSTSLPDGTTATTQSQGDSSTKLATTSYVDTAVSGENLWDRDGTNLITHTYGDNIVTDGAGGGFIGNIDDSANSAFNILLDTSTGLLTHILYDPAFPGDVTAGSGIAWQSFTPTSDIWCPGVSLKTKLSGQVGTLWIYEGEGTGGTLLLEMHSVSMPTPNSFNDITFTKLLFFQNGQKYTWAWERNSGGYSFLQKSGYTGGTNNTGNDYLFKIYYATTTGIKLDKSTGDFTAGENLTIGSGAAGVDYTLTFHGENNDGVVTWLEDEAEYQLDHKAKYTSHPTFVNDEDIVDKKYVDDAIVSAGGIIHDPLTISSPGQTLFTLGQAPADGTLAILTLNGQIRKYGISDDFTISGTTLTWNDPGGVTLKTTDDFQIWYDIAFVPPGTLDQDNTYYVAKAGNDANNGKSIERPFLTINAATAAVVAQTPSFTNQFRIEIIDGGRYTENVTIPEHTTVTGSGTIIGTISFNAYSNINGPRIEGTLFKNTGAHSSVRSSFISAPPNIKWIQLSGGFLYVDCPYWEHAGSAVGVDQSGSSILYINADRMNSDALASTIQVNGGTCFLDVKYMSKKAAGGAGIRALGGGKVYGTVQEIDALGILDAINVSGASTVKLNSNNINGNVVIAGSSTLDLRGNGSIAGTFTDDTTNTIKIEQSNKIGFQARTATTYSTVTGDGTGYTVIFETEETDIGNGYDNATGIFTAPYAGEYLFSTVVYFKGLTASHTLLDLQLSSTTQGPFLIFINPAPIRVNTDEIIQGGCMKLKLAKGDTVKVVARVANGTKVVNVLAASYFSGTLIQTL